MSDASNIAAGNSMLVKVTSRLRLVPKARAVKGQDESELCRRIVLQPRQASQP